VAYNSGDFYFKDGTTGGRETTAFLSGNPLWTVDKYGRFYTFDSFADLYQYETASSPDTNFSAASMSPQWLTYIKETKKFYCLVNPPIALYSFTVGDTNGDVIRSAVGISLSVSGLSAIAHFAIDKDGTVFCQGDISSIHYIEKGTISSGSYNPSGSVFIANPLDTVWESRLLNGTLYYLVQTTSSSTVVTLHAMDYNLKEKWNVPLAAVGVGATAVSAANIAGWRGDKLYVYVEDDVSGQAFYEVDIKSHTAVVMQ
jgi:hypothetical protein